MGASLNKSIVSSAAIMAIVFAGMAAVEQPALADTTSNPPAQASRIDPHTAGQVQASRAAGKNGWHSIADDALHKSLKKLKSAKVKKAASLAGRGLRIGNVQISGRHVHATVRWDYPTLRKNGNQQFRIRLAGSHKPGTGASRSVVVEKTLKGQHSETVDFGLSAAKAKQFRKMATVYLAASQRYDSPTDNDKLFEEFHVGSVRLAPSKRGGTWRILSQRDSSRFNGSLHSNANAVDFSGADLRNIYHPGAQKSARSNVATNNDRSFAPYYAGCTRGTSTTQKYRNVNAMGANLQGQSFSPQSEFVDTLLSGANLTHTCWLTGTTTNSKTGKQVTQKVNADGSNFGPSNSYFTANLTRADLSGAHFKNANFTAQNFGAFRANMTNMDNVNVTNACLTNASLQQASLQNVNFTTIGNDYCAGTSNVNLVGANLSGSIWNGMHLAGINFNGANFTNGSLYSVDFDGINVAAWQAPSGDWIPTTFNNVDLSSAAMVNLESTNFQGDVFVGTNLSNQILAPQPGLGWPTFDYAWFSNANLSNTEMTTGTFADEPGRFNIATFTNGTQLPSNLSGIAFDGGNTDWGNNCLGITGQNQNYAQFTNLNIPNTNFSNTTLVCTNFSGTTLDGSTFNGAPIQASDFTNASAQNINWNQTIAGETSQVYRVNFTNANLSGGNFTTLDMQGLSMSNANLSNSAFTGTQLQNANLAGANFTGASLDNANLNNATPSGLTNTAGCANTTWYTNTTKNGPCTP